ncbi:MAG: HAD family hydrolase [Candidatus Bathyarchaeota archaeon]|nr:MAG: HAD family hydrolase [Candidatus Bathyarchaeota archaeon]
MNRSSIIIRLKSTNSLWMWIYVTIKAVIFDLDGTVAKFNLEYRVVRAEVISFLISRGLPASVFSLDESIFEMLKKTEIFLHNLGRDQVELPEIQNMALAIASSYELKAAHTTALLPGVLEVLKELKQRGLKLAIFTINGKSSTKIILRNLRIREFFDAVVTRDDTSRVKPDPIHLTRTLEALDVSPNQAVVVGDSEVDLACARALKVQCFGVATETNASRLPRNTTTAPILDSITDLPKALSHLS